METTGHTLNLQRLEVLYIVKTLGALEEAELERYCIENNLFSYMDLRIILSELVEESFLFALPGVGSQAYLLSSKGREGLEQFLTSVPYSLRERIDETGREWKMQIRKERQVFADFQEHGRVCVVRLYLMDEGVLLMDLTIELPSKEQAAALCRRWREDTANTYQRVLAALAGPQAD